MLLFFLSENFFFFKNFKNNLKLILKKKKKKKIINGVPPYDFHKFKKKFSENLIKNDMIYDSNLLPSPTAIASSKEFLFNLNVPEKVAQVSKNN